MNNHAHDPKWTAYALDEITDEQERAEIESILAKSAEMRELVREIRQAAGFLKEGLQSEPAVSLTQAQRELIEAKAAAGRRWFGLKPAWTMAYAAAAILLIALVVVKQLQHITHPQVPLARDQIQTPAPTPIHTPPQHPAQAQAPKPVPKPNTLVAGANKKNTNTIGPVKKDSPETKVYVPEAPPVIEIAANNRPPLPEISPKGGIGTEKFKDELRAIIEKSSPNLILTTEPSTASVLDSKVIQRLPTTTNDVMDLINVIGGVIPPSDTIFGANSQMLGGTMAPGIAAIRDGINVNEVRWDSGIQTPNKINTELVQEVRVILSPADAEYGRGAGQVQITTKKEESSKPAKDNDKNTNSNYKTELSSTTGATKSWPGSQTPSGTNSLSPQLNSQQRSISAQVLGSSSVSALQDDVRIVADDGTNSIIMNGTIADISFLTESIKKMGVLPRQVPSPDRWTSPPPFPPRPPDYKGVWPPPRYHLGWFNTEAYDHIRDNAFLDVRQDPLSTLSIDVDTASYSNTRRFLENGQFPPIDAVRIEEFVNYFDYEYKAPKDGNPFAANFEIAEAPWNPSHRLMRIALKGREVNPAKRPNTNLVFLLDISGSMVDANKLPFVKESMKMLVDRLTESDRVAIVTYATDASLYLPSTSGDQKSKLKNAIEQLQAGGSTNGAGGIQLAYRTAREHFIKNGANRIILATDGDFNVGITDRGSLTRLIEKEAQSGIFLSALGYGMGNLKDSTLELLADKGRGNYAYINSLQEAYKVLVEQMDATLIAIAKDVKIQVEFNPRHVSAYRLIGYEDRVMTKEDFKNDAKMAGVIGAGHTVTALYELVPPGEIAVSTPGVNPLKYQKASAPSPSAFSDEVATVHLSYKEPEKDVSVESEFAVKETEAKFKRASKDFKFAAAVAAFGMILRNSQYKGSADFADVLDWANAGRGDDARGYRAEFIRLIRRAMSIAY